MYLTPEQFAETYPGIVQAHTWAYHLRRWRRAGRLTMHTEVIPVRRGRATAWAYREISVLGIIQQDRERSFCAAVWYEHHKTIADRLSDAGQ